MCGTQNLPHTPWHIALPLQTEEQQQKSTKMDLLHIKCSMCISQIFMIQLTPRYHRSSIHPLHFASGWKEQMSSLEYMKADRASSQECKVFSRSKDMETNGNVSILENIYNAERTKEREKLRRLNRKRLKQYKWSKQYKNKVASEDNPKHWRSRKKKEPPCFNSPALRPHRYSRSNTFLKMSFIKLKNQYRQYFHEFNTRHSFWYQQEWNGKNTKTVLSVSVTTERKHWGKKRETWGFLQTPVPFSCISARDHKNTCSDQLSGANW